MKSPSTKLECVIAFASILLLPILPVQSQGNLVFNGTFAGNAAGWTLTNGAYFSVGLVGLDSISPSLSTDPTARQAITGFVPGQVYNVSGVYVAGKDRGGGSPSDLSFGVALDGFYLFQTMLPTTAGFHDFTFLYTATASTALLSLSGQMNGSGQSYFIDNIVIAVPEPSSLALSILLGSGVWTYVRRTRKHSSFQQHGLGPLCFPIPGRNPSDNTVRNAKL